MAEESGVCGGGGNKRVVVTESWARVGFVEFIDDAVADADPATLREVRAEAAAKADEVPPRRGEVRVRGVSASGGFLRAIYYYYCLEWFMFMAMVLFWRTKHIMQVCNDGVSVGRSNDVCRQNLNQIYITAVT